MTYGPDSMTILVHRDTRLSLHCNLNDFKNNYYNVLPAEPVSSHTEDNFGGSPLQAYTYNRSNREQSTSTSQYC
eukprot:6466186-Amphidinium_carterae.3